MITEFIQKNILLKHQRYLINKFANYHVSDVPEENEKQIAMQMKEEALTAAGFDNEANYTAEKIERATSKLKETSRIDRKIIHAITRVKVRENDYFGDSDDEKEPGRGLRSMSVLYEGVDQAPLIA